MPAPGKHAVSPVRTIDFAGDFLHSGNFFPIHLPPRDAERGCRRPKLEMKPPAACLASCSHSAPQCLVTQVKANCTSSLSVSLSVLILQRAGDWCQQCAVFISPVTSWLTCTKCNMKLRLAGMSFYRFATHWCLPLKQRELWAMTRSLDQNKPIMIL